ncbi:MAG: hypothetical protein JSV80_17820 [Acidobacteriota bacterium]|nr:MAG: hypothetical protein JSV80_17820 [Acidobacteriota bacterium]
MDRFRFGLPAGLTTAPLVRGLDRPEARKRVQLVAHADPSVIGRQLLDGELDAALMAPQQAADGSERLELIPGMAVTTRGNSGLAILHHRRGLGELRSIACLGPADTAGMLLKILFSSAGFCPDLTAWTGASAGALDSCDGLLVAGDRALIESPSPEYSRLDLGQAWTQLTGLPFVWLVGAARPGVVDRELYGLLHTARARGRRAWPALARQFAQRHGTSERHLVEIVEKAVVFRLGRPELDGLLAFWEAAAQAGLLRPSNGPRFVPLSAGTFCRSWAESRRSG